VAITVERFISIWYPLRAAQISTKKNARIIIIGTYIICAVLTAFPFWVLGKVEADGEIYCGFYNADVYNRWNWAINRAGSLIIPSGILFITTALIVIKLKQIQKQRSGLVNQNQYQKSGSIENQLTLMLIAVSVAFLLLRLPYTICYYLNTYRKHFFHPVSQQLESSLKTATGITDAIASANYSINFFLYCLSGTAFRSQFILLVCCKVHKLNRRPTASSPYTVSTSAGASVRMKQTDFV
jgi:growth hormone secretagogue receptor